MTAEIARHLERLAAADAVWYASVRPDGRPHLAPIWHVWAEDAIWICTDTSTVRSRNLQQSSWVSVAIADTKSPIIVEGSASEATDPSGEVMAQFKSKYDWDIADYKNRCLIRIEPIKLMVWDVGSESTTKFRWRDGEWLTG